MADSINEISKLIVAEALRNSLVSAGRYNPNDVVKPTAILWTDVDHQWATVIPHLRNLLPELLVYGSYQPEKKTGPAIWLRCVIERMLPAVELPENAIPIIYLPGVSRQLLRNAQECPDELKPFVELQYRGVCWTQKNGKDWTVEAFMVSDDGGLVLDIARDAATKASMIRSLAELASCPITKLQGKHLEAEDFDKLMVEDTVKDFLVWLDNPKATREAWSDAKWSAFSSRCKAELGFDPQKDGEIAGAELLGLKEGKWSSVWHRFAESPALYPGIPSHLRKAAPAPKTLFDDRSSWPQHNEEREDSLRKELLQLHNISSSEARQKILETEKEHGARREWVWARLGATPLADALKHLQLLARITEKTPSGATLHGMAEQYATGGWEADAAVLDAMAAVKSSADYQAVQAAIRSVYLNWLQSGAEHFQKLIASTPLPSSDEISGAEIGIGNGCVILFADGLRWDIANKLVSLINIKGWKYQMANHWASLPTVTATAKPAISPIAKKLKGITPGEDFSPVIAETSQAINTDRFRKLLENEKIHYISADETGDPAGKAWTEQGDIDKLGHDQQGKLAWRIGEQLDLLMERLAALIDAGWKEIRIVTDHGWLLMPGGLPKVDLPKYLTESRWARCASVKEGATVGCPTAPWFWNQVQYVAFGPGISCFGNGFEYAHGGASLQECFIPSIMLKVEKAAAGFAAIGSAKWTGLRCRVQVQPANQGMKVDIRIKTNDEHSSIAQVKAVSDKGEASLLVEDDSLEGTSAVIVLIDAAGNVINKKATIIGSEE